MPIPILSTFERSGAANYPLVEDADVQGGWHAVFDVAARDAIPSNLRRHGMFAYVASTNQAYRLEADLLTWTAIAFAAGSVSLQSAYTASAGSPTPIQLDTTRDGINIIDILAQSTPALTVTSSNSSANSIQVTRAPASALTGRGIDINHGVNCTGAGLVITNAGTNASFGIIQTSNAQAIDVTNNGLGTAVGFRITNGPAKTGIAFESVHNGTSTIGSCNRFMRQPTAPTGGRVIDIDTNANFTGTCLRVIKGEATSSSLGISVEQGGTGTGIQSSDSGSGNPSTGSALLLSYTRDGSTGALLTMTKTATVATAGNLGVITTNANVTGHAWSAAHSGTGDYMNVVRVATSTGRWLTLNSNASSGETWRITIGAVIHSIMTVDGRLGLGDATPVSPARLAIKNHTAFTGSASQFTTGAGSTVNVASSNIITLTLDDNTVYVVEARITGRAIAGGVTRAAYVVRALVYREAAGVATFGAASPANDFTDETAAGLDGTLTVAGNDLFVTVTGIASTTLRWAATLHYQGVSLNT